MIREFTIENFKSIESLTLPLGRVTVLIGENGAGKSNVLEAMAFFIAALQRKADHEFLFSRGVRDCRDTEVISAFSARSKKSFHIAAHSGKREGACNLNFELTKDGSFYEWSLSNGPISYDPNNKAWKVRLNVGELAKIEKAAKKLQMEGPANSSNSLDDSIVAAFLPQFAEASRKFRGILSRGLRTTDSPFVIFSPENTALRTFESEGQMRPLGVRGEGLFKLVQQFAEHQPAKFEVDPENRASSEVMRLWWLRFGGHPKHDTT